MKKWRKIVENVPDWTISLDKLGRIRFASKLLLNVDSNHIILFLTPQKNNNRDYERGDSVQATEIRQ